MTLENVISTLKSDIPEIGCVDSVEEEGVHTLKVLGISPDLRLTLLRGSELKVCGQDKVVWFEESIRRHWELRGTFSS
jgi:hypothetical protein